MSLQPSVTLVCLVADRDEMLERAIRCWLAQTMPCNLLVYDNGWPVEWFGSDRLMNCEYVHSPRGNRTIGELRNAANALVQSDIIAHWDSDDYSHPRRIEEQVALLQSSGADCVGYREALFWDTRKKCKFHEDNPASVAPAICPVCHTSLFMASGTDGRWRCGRIGCNASSSDPCVCQHEAWIYRQDKPNYAIGASLCYWRKTWELVPFKPLTIGEDSAWIWDVQVAGGKVASKSSMWEKHESEQWKDVEPMLLDCSPRMVCRIHGNNTSNSYCHDAMHGERAKDYWTRTPEWDGYCKEVCG